ncbi:MAG: DNA primase [Planctomycetota bacterium]|jgi:DNA primase
MIPEEVILQIQNAVDIVEVVREYIPDLKRAGRVFKALCPFHKEKTPSFTVNPERRIFKCFGCGKGGTIFTFLQNLEGVSYPEAVKLLGQRVGIRVPERAGKSQEQYDRISGLYNANEAAAQFFVNTLESDGDGKAAREYLEKRGLAGEIIKTFKVGLAPPAWDGLVQYSRRKKIALSEMEAVGLVRRRQSGDGYYDYFRGRLMFPIFDAQNRIVAFGGRYLENVTEEREKDKKYVNSPESPVFSKSRVLYGLNFARSAIYAEKSVAVVEGYTDVIKAHEADVKNVIASMGTAFTADHARMLKRLEARVVLVFDADEAGLAAARRSLPVLLAEDLEISVAQLPGGKDPFDLITEEGPDVFRKSLHNASDITAFISSAVASAEDMESPDVRTRLIDELLTLTSVIPNQVRRDLWLRAIASRFDVTESAVRDRLASMRKRIRPAERREVRTVVPKQLDSLERAMLEIIVAEPSLVKDIFAIVPPGEFKEPVCARIAVAASELIERYGDFKLDELLVHIGDPSLDSMVTDLAEAYPQNTDFRAAAAKVLLQYRLCNLEKKLDDAKQSLREAQMSGNNTEIDRALKQREELNREIQRLKKGEGVKI